MTVLSQHQAHPFAEVYQVASQGTTPIDLGSFQDGQVVEGVLVQVETPAVGASNLIVGDTDDPDGFIAPADATAIADTIYGATATERGAYLYNATSKAGHWKMYQSISKALKFALSAIPTTEGVFNVIIFGHTTGT